MRVALQNGITGVVIAIALIWFGVAMAGQNQEKFTARLSSVPMDPAMRSAITGHGIVTAVLTGAKLSLDGSFEGLRSPATTARLHRSRVTGVRGTPVFDLNVSHATSGIITGSFELSSNQVESLRRGKLYIQLGSEKAPDGNLWGWLLRQGAPAQ